MEQTNRQLAAAKSAQRTHTGVQALLMALILLASLGVLLFFVAFSGVNSNDRAAFADMLTGDAHRPFVTRVLVPWLTRGIAAVLPEPVHQWAAALPGGSGAVRWLLTKYHTPLGFELEALISLGLQWASVLGFALAFRGLFQALFNVPAAIPSLVTLAALLGMTPMLLFGYIYDLTNLFLTTLALYCIAARRRTAYWVIFALALLNKESAVVLIVPAVLLFWDYGRPSLRKVAIGSLAQIALFLAIRLPLGQLFRDNPGAGFEYHLPDHIEMFLDYPVLGILSIAFAIGMLILVFRGWRTRPAVAVLGVLPGLLLLILFILGGIAFEIRVFSDVYAAGFVCGIYTLLERKSPLEARPPVMQEWVKSLRPLFSRQVN